MISEKILSLHKLLYDVRWRAAEGDYDQLEKEFVQSAESEFVDLETINEMLGQLYIAPYKEHMLPKHLAVKPVGRPSLGTTKKVSLTLPDEIWEMIEKRQEKWGVSRSQTLRKMIEGYYYPENKDSDSEE